MLLKNDVRRSKRIIWTNDEPIFRGSIFSLAVENESCSAISPFHGLYESNRKDLLTFIVDCMCQQRSSYQQMPFLIACCWRCSQTWICYVNNKEIFFLLLNWSFLGTFLIVLYMVLVQTYLGVLFFTNITFLSTQNQI